MSPDPTELARVLSHYDTGVVRSITPIRRGVGSAVKWAVMCERGPRILRRFPLGVDEPGLALIKWVQNEARAAGFPVPPVVPPRAGTDMIRLDGRLYEMAQFVPSSGFDASPAGASAAGGLLRKLHDWLATQKPSIPIAAPSSARGFHRALRVQTELVTAREKLGRDSGPTLRELGALYSLAAERAAAAGADAWPTQLVHGDWHPGNLLFDGHRVVALIDFDSIRLGSRGMDLAYGTLQFSITRSESPPASWPAGADEARLAAFVHGYEAGGPGPVSRGELDALVWLMIEALIAEVIGPVAASGDFGGLDGLGVVRMVHAKAVWLRDRQAELMRHFS